MRQKGLITGSRKFKILSHNYGICVYCNEAPAEQVDHILPRSWKVYNADENLVGACSDCNLIAGNKVFDSFEEKQAYIVNELRKPKWKNRRVALYRFMPAIIEKLNPKPAQKITIETHRVKQEPFTEKELSRIRKKISAALKHLSAGGKFQGYEFLAKKLSKLAGREKDKPWGKEYVACVNGGTLTPGRKFVHALDLYLKNFNPHQWQWFYFVKRNNVAAVYDKSVLGEILLTNFRKIGYKPVTHKRYMQIKHKATARNG